jgi:hypothetical protein
MVIYFNQGNGILKQKIEIKPHILKEVETKIN